MCNAKNLRTRMASIGEAAKRQLHLPLVFTPGVTADTCNLVIPEATYPRRDGLFLRPTDPANPSAGLEPVVGHWNLTPSYYKGPLKGWKLSTNNCRSDRMATSPTFLDACAKRRAIIPVTSFTEWTGPRGSKTAHAISRADGEILFVAGLWERCWPEGEPIETYTMVMIDALGTDDVAPFHDRQPVTLDAESAATWLDLKADYQPIMKAPAPGTLVADPPQLASGLGR